MSEHHKSLVVRIQDIIPHPNADRLEIIKILGYQVVVGKGNFNIGDFGIFITPDSIVPARPEFSFVWEKDGGGVLREVLPLSEVPEKWRRITVRRLRKEYSEGLLMPLKDFPEMDNVVEGEDVAESLGITHYNPPDDEDVPEINGRSVKQSKVWPRSAKGWFYFLSYWLSFGLYNPWGNLGGLNEKAPLVTPPIYDVEAYKNHTSALELAEGEYMVVTEKIHGSNARFVFESGLFGGKFYVGSRKLWKRAGNSIWRQAVKDNPYIEKFCRDYPGYTLYGEVVPTQPGFDYGVPAGYVWVYFFDIRTPEGEWIPYEEARAMTRDYSLMWAPLIMQGCSQGTHPDIEIVICQADGPTLTMGKHIREGVVVRVQPEKHVRGLGRAQVKIISNNYYDRTKE